MINTLLSTKEEFLRTPIEIALDIDEDGMTTAKKLYEFLELAPQNYARWCKSNITENEFAEENVDYWAFVLNDEWGENINSSSMRSFTGRGNTEDYRLTAHFAKKLSMKGSGEKAEQAREYFTRLEERVKQKIIDFSQDKAVLGLQFVKFIADDLRVAESSRLFMYENYCKDVGIPTGFLPKYEDNGNRERLPATELLKRNGCGISTVKFNKLLLQAGYLEEKERASSKGGTKKYKALTEMGLIYGVNLISDKNQKETQPYYYTNTFMELYEKVI